MMTATDAKPPEPETLNPLSFPLSGSRLIEASAGTGKTYTIAALYVRLVLQHGGVDPNSNESLAFERALQPDELLVVTFTEAATEELRDRIRARLSEAASYFRELRGKRETADGFLQQLRADYSELQWPTLARRLDLAAQAMDEASVHTIHGWCNRMLREHAFASGSLFTQQLETDNQELWLLAARDYWRRFYVLQPLPVFTFLRQQFSSPEQLRNSLRVLQQHLPAELAVPDDAVFNRLQQGLAALAALKERTQPAVTELLADMPNHKGITHHLGGLQKLDEWINSAVTEPNITEAGWKRFSEVELQKKFKGQLHPDWQVIWHLPQQLADLALDVQPLKQHAAAWLNQRFHMLQEQRAQMGFDDMLTRLRDALRGSHGERLAAAIREQFPVAMIDEFQDTDPIQYEIFDRIYRLHENHQQQGVFLIGDPKQAIYSFRNADIYTYLKARQATSGRHYTLRTNFRSTTAVVKAANQLFSLAERSPENYPQGPFRFRRGDEDEVPFLPVTANGLKTAAQVLDEPLPGLTIKVSAAEQGGEVKKETLEQELAEGCADDMVRLLTHATLVEGENSQPVSPGQLAVLVNNAREAQLIRNALRQRQVASVYLSDRDSVFAGAIATDMLLLLQSCADPRDPGKLRAALATSVLQFSLATLHQVVEDETLWDNYAAQFIGYHQIWLKRGVLAMLQRVLHDFEVPKRLLQSHAGQAGERLLTDILHLAELLQQQAQHADGMSGLVRFLAEHIEQVREQGNRTDSTEQQVRLESDSELVQVVTIHKSKGLQYPFVFLPFVSMQKAKQHRLNYPAVYHNDAGEIQLALSNADEAGSARADEERLAEDIRKFYVAVTRAQYSTFIYAAKFKEFGETALNYLLSGSREAVGDLTSAMTNAWASTELKVEQIVPAVDKAGDALMYQPQLSAVPEWQYCRVPAEHRLERWWLSSYSSLALAGADEMLARREGAEESADQQNSLEELNEQTRMVSAWAEPKQQPSNTPLHSFPKGPQPGTFLHNLLEAAAAEGFAELANNPQKVAAVVSAYTQLAPWQEYHDVLCDWLSDYLGTNFMLGSPASEQDAVCLADLVTYQAEPEFWFATHQTSVAKLDELIQTYILPAENNGKQSSTNRPALQATTLNGMMKGFIDLVFEWQGRYYVADYKSNWLGMHEEDYTDAAMRQKILASRYDVQYVIYTLALHKLLKARLGQAYSYETHVGGALYLFLRGYKATTAGAFFDRPPYALIEQLEALLGMKQANALTDHLEQLRAWQRQGWLRAVDVSFAEFMVSDADSANTDAKSAVLLASALVSYQLGRGHVALNLAQLFIDPQTTLQLPAARDNGAELERWGTPVTALQQWSPDEFMAALAGSTAVAEGEASVNTPLVLAGERLYLRRYWHYQQQIQRGFQLRAQSRKVDVKELSGVLNDLFESDSDEPVPESAAVNWQKIACANTVRTGFSVITGGPGTGKTYTVVRLLATLQQLSMAEGGSERILLAAPTGKAAARMTESIRKELNELTLTEAVKRSIDPTAVTLHRLLGARPGSRGFRHHADNPLMADTVIVDEASMVDVEMMALLLDALPRHARLVLLGDKDQLASVEAGAVLGNLCQDAEAGGYTKATLDWLEAASGESLSRDLMLNAASGTAEQNPWLQHIVMLRHSRRFDEHSGIGKLAGEVNAMQSGWVRHWLASNSPQPGEAAELYQSLTALMPAEPTDAALATVIKAGYGAYLECLAQPPATTDAEHIDRWALAVLTAFGSFQVLCAVREGDWGTYALNQRIEQWLGSAVSLAVSATAERDHWYVGRPVMVTRNDYGLDLRNGDIGIVLNHQPSGTWRVAFITTENRIRWVLPSRLTHVDTVYAMTVHKSQGSEFAHTMLVLPERDTPVLTKELLYTGITRAKRKLTLVVPNQRVLFDSMTRCVERG